MHRPGNTPRRQGWMQSAPPTTASSPGSTASTCNASPTPSKPPSARRSSGSSPADLAPNATAPDSPRPHELSTRLGWLADRLRAVGHRDSDLLASLTQVQTLRQVLGMLDPSAPLSRRTLQQMIDACGGRGGSALAHQEVAEWTVTTRPAQLSAAGGTVLWWGPEAEAASPPVVWDQAESAALTAAGARLLEPEALAALQVEAGIAGMAGARTVVAVLPGRRLEEPARPSSLLARL